MGVKKKKEVGETISSTAGERAKTCDDYDIGLTTDSIRFGCRIIRDGSFPAVKPYDGVTDGASSQDIPVKSSPKGM
jgi:hypothetical protein